MKIFGVLAILSTLYTQGTSLTCHKVTDFSSEIAPVDDVCDGGVTTCVRPIMKDGGTYEATGSKWGCGVCDPVAACVSCETEKCNAAPTFKCLATDNYTGEPESEVCPDRIPTGSDAFKPETTCVRPTFMDGTYTYITDGTKWGCGECEKTANCIDVCETADCNEAAQLTCHKYTVSSGAWMKDGQVDCVDVQGCNLRTPDSVTTEAEDATYDSCGECAQGLAAGVCKKCTGVDCNDIEDHLYCKKGANDAVLAGLEQNFCEDDVKSCQRPEFSYAVVGAVAYGCGDCEDEDNAAIANCKTCEESDCNSIPTEKNHKCYTYTLGDDDKWAKSVAMAVCVNGDNGVEDKCNMPADLAVKAGYTEGAGCGPCKDADDACTTTEAEKNVGQKAMVSLLVTILPLLYVML